MTTSTVDHTKFAPKGKEAPPNPSEKPQRWWRSPPAQLPSAIFGVYSALLAQQTTRRDLNRKLRYLYGESEPFGPSASPFPRAGDSPNRGAPRERTGHNIIGEVIDTVAAKIAKNRPKSTFVVDDGDFRQQQRARKADRYVQGAYHVGKFYSEALECFLDACVEDIGALLLYRYRGGSEIRAERVWPDELFVDPEDGMYGCPRQLLRVKSVHRETLREAYGDAVGDLDKAMSPPPIPGVTRVLGDLVVVVEAWHLPIDDKGADGKHVVCTSNAVLLEDGWKRRRFPIEFFRWKKRRRGFYGIGIAEQLLIDQLGINKLLRRIDEILHLCSVPRYLVEEASEVVEDRLTNAIGAIIKFRGTAPQVQTGNMVAPELFAEVERRKARAFERIGVSQLNVASVKPAGLNSQPSLREYSDIGSERFALVAQSWEDFHLGITQQVVDLSAEAEEDAKTAAKDGKKKSGPTVKMPGKDGLERLSWADVKLDEEDFVLKVFPTSSLPTTPAARQQTIAEWQAQGWVDPLEARKLMDMPDLDASTNVAEAGRDDIEWTVQQFLESDTYHPPEPYQDLAYGVRRMGLAYLRAKHQGVPGERLANMQTWINEAQEMVAAAQAAAAAPPAGPAAAPGPNPSPPPAMAA